MSTWPTRRSIFSVEKTHNGLFPGDEIEGATPTVNVNGDLDVHPNRIHTTQVAGDVREFTLPANIRLSAGQTYHWGIEVVDTAGVSQRASFPYRAPIATADQQNRFSSVTLITHGRELPYVDQSVTEDYLELARSVAKMSGGAVAVYDPATGLWKDDNPSDSILASINRGGSLVLVADWAKDSAISDSGFAEAAADAMFASLMTLNEGLFPFNDQIIDPVLGSPLHFIGFGRGASVNTEILQRLGVYFGSTTADVHVTTLDPHDFDQDSLNLSARNYLDLMKEFSPTFDFLTLLSPDETITDIVQTLTDTASIKYGDLDDPQVTTWDNVTFADNYYQQAAGETEQDTDDDLDDLSFTVNGRAVAGADIDVRLGGGPLANEHRSGFFADDKRNLVHQRVKAWYAGTVDTSLNVFPSEKAGRLVETVRRSGRPDRPRLARTWYGGGLQSAVVSRRRTERSELGRRRCRLVLLGARRRNAASTQWNGHSHTGQHVEQRSRCADHRRTDARRADRLQRTFRYQFAA